MISLLDRGEELIICTLGHRVEQVGTINFTFIPSA